MIKKITTCARCFDMNTSCYKIFDISYDPHTTKILKKSSYFCCKECIKKLNTQFKKSTRRKFYLCTTRTQNY